MGSVREGPAQSSNSHSLIQVWYTLSTQLQDWFSSHDSLTWCLATTALLPIWPQVSGQVSAVQAQLHCSTPHCINHLLSCGYFTLKYNLLAVQGDERQIVSFPASLVGPTCSLLDTHIAGVPATFADRIPQSNPTTRRAFFP